MSHDFVDQQQYQDIEEPDLHISGKLEVAQTPELMAVSGSIRGITEAIQLDKGITATAVQELQKQLETVKIDFYGQQLALIEVKEIPDLEKNIKIFEEIMTGEFEHVRELTYMPPAIAGLILYAGWDSPWFRLKVFPPESAKICSQFQPSQDKGSPSLYFEDLEELSDETAKHLGNSKLELLFFGSTKISPQGYKYLAKNKGSLYFGRFPELSDELIENLANYQGESLTIGGETELTDKQLKMLANSSVPYLSFSCGELSDAAAEALSHYHGKLGFESLERLSDHAAEILSQSSTVTEVLFKARLELSGRARRLLFKKAKYSTEVV